jgi:superfamily II DNA or RNA helicase
MQMLNTYLGQKGYTILKSELSLQQQYMIREELTIKPFVPGSPANNNATTFPAYRESPAKYYVPRYFGEKMFGPVKEYKIAQGSDINVAFSGDLRENQKEIVKSYLNHIENQNNYGGGLLEVPCGGGKTVMGINIISKLQKKTLIIVHKEFLMNQWIERIQQFLPGACIGKIQGPIIDIEDKDIVIGMIQSIANDS